VPIAEKAQQLPHGPWSLTGWRQASVRQSNYAVDKAIDLHTLQSCYAVFTEAGTWDTTPLPEVQTGVSRSSGNFKPK